MISVDKISLSFGDYHLFREISFLLNSRDKVGLVGRNGAGKTTLLRILTGQQQPDSGVVRIPGGIRMGYLPQQMSLEDGKTLFREAESAFDEIMMLESEIDQISREINVRTDYDSPEYMDLLEQLSEKTERFHLLQGNSRDQKIEQVLKGLGFRRDDFSRLVSEFSGGWRMRIELAKVLLRSPDVILLDEPTNHLDIESIQWLEEFLGDYHGTVVLISHDRVFLDRVTNRTVEITMGAIHDYRVPYSQYAGLRKERREQQMAAYKNQQKKISDTREFIERFRYKATKAIQVQSRIKMLEKMELIEVDEEDVSHINIRFSPAPRSGTVVLEARDLSFSYGSDRVLDRIDLILHRGERIAFVGRNGEGKTTLTAIMAGHLSARGLLKTGYHVKTGYYAQNQDALLDGDKTVLETVDEVAVGDIRTRIRDLLGAFLFSGEDVDKKVKVLSGGERSRLALARMLLKPCNLLILDEPTNHLDMRSKDILKQALMKYEGTLIVVSHDREFLDGLVDKVYEFNGHKIREHLGGIYDFLQKKKMESLSDLEKNEIIRETVSGDVKSYVKKDSRLSWEMKKEFDREMNRLFRQIAKTEAQIEKNEDELRKCEMQIDRASGNAGDGPDPFYFDLYRDLQDQISLKMERWELLHKELEALKSKRK
ncbi:MAG: ATP-binding cassette domain-containing protein [Bacteroidales bacterium]|nr:ATP-binding cassette domain-containing protein [Bacteroidales bacterium]